MSRRIAANGDRLLSVSEYESSDNKLSYSESSDVATTRNPNYVSDDDDSWHSSDEDFIDDDSLISVR